MDDQVLTHWPTTIGILGCGSSTGVPLVGNQWGLCDPKQPKNNRTRCAAMYVWANETWLIDVTPDFRSQALQANIQEVHGVLLTHAHYDHIGGLEDLKPLARRYNRLIPVWMSAQTYDILRVRCPYAWHSSTHVGYDAFLTPHIINGPFDTGNGLPIVPFEQDHGYSTTLGFRFPQWAYSTDVVRLSNEAMSLLRHLDLWFVDAVSLTPRQTHSHLDQALGWIDQLGPRHSVLIHMGADMDYDTLCANLPHHVRPAYDGWRWHNGVIE